MKTSTRKKSILKRVALFSTWLMLLPFAGRTPAEMCTPDVVPAATLLLPYFEVDLSDHDGDGEADGDGVNTVFSINNALPQPTLAHITFWTDWSWTTIDFDVFLTGYDVVHVDLFRAIGLGSLPVTADQQADPDDTISPHHDHPEWDGTFDFCAGVFPYPDPIVTGGLLDRIQNGHSGFPVASLPGGGCVGEALNGEGSCAGGSCPPGTIARGYVTIDNSNACGTVFPFEPGYFEDGGEGLASNVNQLWGDSYFVNPGGLFPVATQPLVHVEADDAFNASSTATNYTFYGRYTQGDGGIDNREPLGSTWAVRYADAAEHHTDLVVWRDATAGLATAQQSWDCGTGRPAGPDWRPLRETQVVCFDDTEDAVEVCTGAPDSICFPLGTQRLAAPELPVPFAGGWCLLNLNVPANDDPELDVDFPADPPGPVAQSWVGALHNFSGEVTAGVRGIELGSACVDLDPLLDQPLFIDGFESGNTSAWSAAVP